MNRLLRLLTFAILLVTACSGLAQAQTEASTKPSFPVPFGPSNAGREFWLSFPTNWNVPQADKNYIRLYITAGTRTAVNISVGPTQVPTVYTKPYDVITVTLSSNGAQVIVRDDQAPVPIDQVYKNAAVHIQADAPIVVYGMNRTSFTTDGLLALPTNALGREYIVASAADIADGTLQKLPSQYLVIAPYDNTTVSIIHPMDSPNHPANQIFSISLNKGDVFSAMSTGPLGDLSGAWIRASQPIAVTAGQNCTYLPDANYCCCDHLEEMLLPVSSWGKFYQSVPYALRIKGDMFRIFAGEEDTHVYINGNLYGTISGKGGPNGQGWFEYLPPDRGLIEFSADKPISVAQYNNSAAYDNTQNTDPFYCMLTPVEQYQTQLVFTTPSQDYPTNNINLVCDSAGYYQMEIAPGGTNNWEKLSTKFGPINKTFKTKINGRTYAGITLSIAAGTYRMRGTTPFAGYIYGSSQYDSYGYPLSVAVGDLSVKDSIPPTITLKVDCSGNVTGSTTDYPDPDNERSNLSSIELDEGSDNYLLLPTTFDPGVSRSAFVKLQVVDKTKDAVAYLVISDMAGNVSRDTIRYSAFNVVAEPNPVSFGSFILGQNATKTVTIKNLSPAPIALKDARLNLGTQGFTLLSPTGAFTLGPAGSATDHVDAQVRFDALKSGAAADSISVEDSCGLRPLALLTALVGTPIIKVSDVDWDVKYGPTLVGKKANTEQVIVRNASTDGGVLTVYPPASGPTDPVFTTPNGLPLTQFDLAPGATQAVNVSFQPQAVKRYIDSIVFPNNAPPNPANDSVGLLMGSGVEPGLIATSHDWGRKRVGTGPYIDSVLLTNTGTSSVTVNGIDSTTEEISDFKVIDVTRASVQIDAGESVYVPVSFLPTAIGPRRMKIYYQVKGVTGLHFSTLSGIGIIPRLATDDVDFGSMKVGDPPVQMPARFYIPADLDGYTDSVMIKGIRFRGTDNDFSVQPIDTAVTLIPGVRDTLLLTGFFAASSAGAHTTSLVALTPDTLGVSSTNAAPDSVSIWKGFGTTEANGQLTVTALPASTCLGDTALIIVHFDNPGDVPVTIQRMTLNGSTTLTVVDPTTQFTLDPHTSRDLTVRFVPTDMIPQNAVLVVENTAGGGPINVQLSGVAFNVTVPAHVDLVGNKGKVADLSTQVAATVSLSDQIAPAQVTQYRVTFTYNGKHFFPDTTSAKFVIGGANPSATATYNAAASSLGKFVVDVTSPTPIAAPGDLLKVQFAVLFDSTLTRSINADVAFVDTKCATVISGLDSIGITPLCGLNLRLIEITSSKYSLDQNAPNPGHPITKIKYSLGLDGPTTMMLYDMQGNAVQTLVSQYQQPGTYELTIDATNLPSGSYYYKLTSGTWSETKRLDIAK